MKRGTKEGMINSSNNSASIRKKEILKELVIIELRKSDNPLSTSDLAQKIGKAWHTIDRACLMLQIDNKINGFKIGNMNLWNLKKSSKYNTYPVKNELTEFLEDEK